MFPAYLLNTDIARVAPLMAAPAFFTLLALAALGAPMLALICRTGAEALRTQHLEVYARRLLRMAVSLAVLSGVVLAGALGLALARLPWAWDWVRSDPTAPALLALCAAAYVASLAAARASAPARYQRGDSPVLKAFVLALLSLVLAWLTLSVLGDFAQQARAVLLAPSEDSLTIAALAPPRLEPPGLHLAAAVLATMLLAVTCASAVSMEYLMLRRDHDPFGREAFAQALRLGARSSLRSGILVAATYPMTWMHLTTLLEGRPEAQAIKVLLAFSLGSLILACLLWAALSRSQRPHNSGPAMHGSLLCLWTCLALLLSAALLYFYAG